MTDTATKATIVLAVVAGLAFVVNVWQAFQTRKTIEAATAATRPEWQPLLNTTRRALSGTRAEGMLTEESSSDKP